MKTNIYNLVEKRGSHKTNTISLEKVDCKIHEPKTKRKRLVRDNNDYITNPNLIKTINNT